MAENLIINAKEKRERYIELLPQISALIADENDLIANLANISAALHMTFNWLWVGFYLVKGNQLVLAPFQGPIACTRIAYAKGVCGTAWETGKTQLVVDVNQFPGHIACSSLARSEIVIPILNKQNKVIGVLDIDSSELNDFDMIDQYYLEQLITKINLDLFTLSDSVS